MRKIIVRTDVSSLEAGFKEKRVGGEEIASRGRRNQDACPFEDALAVKVNLIAGGVERKELVGGGRQDLRAVNRPLRELEERRIKRLAWGRDGQGVVNRL